MFNYELSGTTPPEMYSQIYGGGYPNFNMGPSYSYETSGGLGGSGASLGLGRMSPLPRRRYSIGGLPSMGDNFYSSQHQQQHTPNISNLLNETSKSISRSSQILNRRFSGSLTGLHDGIIGGVSGVSGVGGGGIGTTTGYGSGILGAGYSSGGVGGAGGIGGLSGSGIGVGGVSSFPTLNLRNNYVDSNNIIPMSSNFYSHPNIYSQPNFQSTNNTNYNNFDYNNFNKYHNLSNTTSNKLSSQDYLYTSKPIFSNTHSMPHQQTQKPTPNYLQAHLNPYTSTHSTTYNTNHLTHHPITSSSFLHHQYNPPISSSHPHYYHHHHSSNPAISHSANLLPHSYNHTNYPIKSSFNSGGGYTNQHFDHLAHLNSSSSSNYPKFDLDFGKPAEVKRQVSFKFDVDTLSID